MRWRWRGFLRGLLVGLPLLALQLALGWPAFRDGDAPCWAVLILFLAFNAASDAVVDPVSTRIEKGMDSGGAVILRLGFLGAVLLAATDAGHFRAGPSFPLAARWVTVGLLALGWFLRLAAYAVNDFFANVIVLQA